METYKINALILEKPNSPPHGKKDFRPVRLWGYLTQLDSIG